MTLKWIIVTNCVTYCTYCVTYWVTYWLTVWLVNAGWWRGDCWLMTRVLSMTGLVFTRMTPDFLSPLIPQWPHWDSSQTSSAFTVSERLHLLFEQTIFISFTANIVVGQYCIVPSQTCTQVDNDNINCRFLSQLFHWQSWIRRISVDIHVSSTWDQMMKKKRIRRKECSVNLGLICYIILNN